MAQTKPKSCNKFNSSRIVTTKKKIRWRSYEMKYFFLKDWNTLRVSKIGVLVIPFNNSRCKKRIFEKVIRGILPTVLVAYGVLLTGMRLKRYFGLGEWMTHFKRRHASCVSNSLSSQVNLYNPVVTTGNTNAVNEALAIGRVCAALQKYGRPWWWMYNRLYRHFVERF